MKTHKQYRVVFTQLHNVNGDMLRGSFSTKWFNSLEAAESCRWIREDDAAIVSRDYEAYETGPRVSLLPVVSNPKPEGEEQMQ